MKRKRILVLIPSCVVLALLCLVLRGWFFAPEPATAVSQFFSYDQEVPLDAVVTYQSETEEYTVSQVVFSSVNRARVPGLLFLPKDADKPLPAILYQHGAGNSKNGDYIVAGLDLFARSGFVAMAIDAEFHGERAVEGYDMDADTFLDVPPVELRNAIIQTVVDLRRATDFLCSLDQVDGDRIGYLGISLGGIMGATLAGLDDRIKVCILAVAGGGFGKIARFGTLVDFAEVPDELLEMAAIIDPMNYVAMISPRRLHMMNAEQDDLMPPISSKLLYAKARAPKSITWYDSGHELPRDEALEEARAVFQKYL